jgi:hypothetical protein
MLVKLLCKVINAQFHLVKSCYAEVKMKAIHPFFLLKENIVSNPSETWYSQSFLSGIGQVDSPNNSKYNIWSVQSNFNQVIYTG